MNDKTSALILLILVAAIFFVFLAVCFFVLKQLNKVKKTQDKLFQLFPDPESVDALMKLAEEHQSLSRQTNALQREVSDIREKQKACFDRINIVRYCAAGENGAKMSYSVGLTNSNEDGLVITGLHYRNTTNLYFKEVHEGIGDFPLSSEEKEAVGRSKISKVCG